MIIEYKSIKESFLFVIFLFFITSLIYSSGKIGDIDSKKGIKTETKLEYRYAEEKSQFKQYLYMKMVTDYNENGKKIKHARYGPDDSLIETYFFKYDFEKNIIEQTKFDSKGDYKGRDIFKNESILELNEDHFDDVLDWKYSYKYDSNNKLVEQLRYDMNDNLKQRDVYKYDAKGNLVEELWLGGLQGYVNLDPNSDLIDRYVYKYDLEGNNIEKSRKSPKQHFNWRYTYKYNNQNNIIEIIIYEYELRLGELEEVPTSKTTFDYIYF